MNRFFVYRAPLPPTVKGAVVLSEDDYYIFVNEGLSPEESARVIEHEKSHIMGRHMRGEKTAAECEKEAIFPYTLE